MISRSGDKQKRIELAREDARRKRIDAGLPLVDEKPVEKLKARTKSKVK